MRLWGLGRRWSGWGGAHPDYGCLCLHYLPLIHKNPEELMFFSGTGLPGLSRNKGRRTMMMMMLLLQALS